MTARGCVVWLQPGAERGPDLIAAALRVWGGAPAGWALARFCGVCGRPGHGAPILPWPGAPAVSVSYTDGLAAVALADAGLVGVDVEAVRPLARPDDLAAWVWGPGERPDAGVTADLLPWLYRDWTRKEAVLKAHRVGLSVPMASFEASGPVRVGGRAALHVVDLPDAARFGAAGAVAVPPGTRVSVRIGLDEAGDRVGSAGE